MVMKNTFSRRNFVQSGALVAAAGVASKAVPSLAQPLPVSGKPSPIHLGAGQLYVPELHRATR